MKLHFISFSLIGNWQSRSVYAPLWQLQNPLGYLWMGITAEAFTTHPSVSVFLFLINCCNALLHLAWSPLLSNVFLPSCPQPLTIKVDVAVFVEVNVGEDLLQLSFLQLLPKEGLHALLQLIQRDLSIAIAVKLQCAP